jgi:hypothetical protein
VGSKKWSMMRLKWSRRISTWHAQVHESGVSLCGNVECNACNDCIKRPEVPLLLFLMWRMLSLMRIISFAAKTDV